MLPPIYSVLAALALAGNSDDATSIIITEATNANLILPIFSSFPFWFMIGLTPLENPVNDDGNVEKNVHFLLPAR
jgi:hypothetical protein